jgi:hypothetical protein
MGFKDQNIDSKRDRAGMFIPALLYFSSSILENGGELTGAFGEFIFWI